MTEPAAAQANTELPVVHVRGPADLVELIPYLLGFHPTDSVVVVELRQEWRRMGMLIRADLAALGDGGGFACEVAATLGRAGADGAVVVVYGSSPMPADVAARQLVGRLVAALGAVRVPLCDALHVVDRRWRSYFCTDSRCCPAAGTPTADPAQPTSAIAVAATVAGRVARPDRQALERSVQPPTDSPDQAMRAALRRAEEARVHAAEVPGGAAAWRAAARRQFRRVLEVAGERRRDAPVPRRLTEQETADLLVGLTDFGVRDACWRELDRRGSSDAFALWWQLAHRAWPPYDVAPLFLLGWAAWRGGDGALARVAVGRALASDASYDAARLLLVALDHGVDPRSLPSVAATPHRRSLQSRR